LCREFATRDYIAVGDSMFALLICQDKEMWTMMVWLHQLQSCSSVGAFLASLIIAALPTFVVFVFTQNVIMRSIVVPVEKWPSTSSFERS